MLLLALGCAEPTGAALTLDYFAMTDVVGFHLEVDRVACGPGEALTPYHLEAEVDLLDGIAPGQVELIEQGAFDEDSRHTAADLFVSLEPGCYDVLAAPAAEIDIRSGAWTPSESCSVARSRGLEVIESQTSEALLRSQCVGDPLGGGDFTILLNHGPVITSSVPASFNYECQAAEVCVEFHDPDDDPLQVSWSHDQEAELHALDLGELEVIDFDDGHRLWRQCAHIVAEEAATYLWTVVVLDVGSDGSAEAPIEELTGEPSRDELSFPIVTNWVDDPMCFDVRGDLVPVEDLSVERVDGCSITSAEEWYCSGRHDVDASERELYCDGGALVETALYPACDGGPGQPM